MKNPVPWFKNSLIYRLWRRLRRIIRGPGWHVLNTMEEFRGYDIGDWSYGGMQVYDFYDGTRLKIGKYCSIHPTTNIMLGGEHDPRCVTTHPIDLFLIPRSELKNDPVFPTSKGDVVIGHDVFIGIGSTILSGVTIGNGAVIGAGSVVSKNIPPYAVAVGSPISVVKYRFPPEIVERLQKLAWWDWPDAKVREAQPMLQSRDLGQFLAKYEKKA